MEAHLLSSTTFTNQFSFLQTKNKARVSLISPIKKKERKRKDEFKKQSMVSGSNHRSRGGLERPVGTMPVELHDPICESTYPKQREIRCSGEQVLFFVHHPPCLL